MKTFVSMLALAIALAWPAVGDAQSSKAKARSTTTMQQQNVQRHAKVKRAPAAKPCVARTWHGCLGWDPDPNVREMIRRDSNLDDL